MSRRHFTVLTMNLGLMSILGYEPVPHVKKRLDSFPRLVLPLDADVLCLQEVWSVSHVEQLISELAGEYPHVTAFPVGEDDIFVRSGLCIFSRYEIGAADYIVYDGYPAVHEYVARKGAISVQMQTPLGITAVVNTHLVCGSPLFDPNGASMRKMRGRQIEDVAELADKQHADACIIAGDFNAGPATSTENYAAMATHGYHDVRYSAVAPHATLLDPTWDRDNALNAKEKHAVSDRIDHIFLAAHDAPHVSVASYRVVMTEPVVRAGRGIMVPVSDHYGALATFVRR